MTFASVLGIVTWLVGVPLVTGMLFVQPRWHRWMLGLMAFATCHIKKPFYMEIFFEEYRGVDRGFGVTIPDLLFFGFLFYLFLTIGQRKLIWWPTNSTLWVLVILISAISLCESQVAYYGLFTLHKFIRGFILFWVIVNVVKEKEDVQAVILGLTAAVIFEAGLVLFEKYVTKSVVNRSMGSFPHPNSLAMYVDLIIPTLLSVFLSGTLVKRHNKWLVIAVFAGMVCVVFTKSRGALVIMLGALGVVTAVSLLVKPTARKFALVAVGMVLVSIMGAFAAPRLIQRFETAPKESEETREYFNEAAHAMANERTFGVGLNAFAWMLANTEYYWYVYPDKKEDESLDPDEFRDSTQGASRLGTAHHIYFLMAAETGWAGMWIFILFLVRFYGHNLWLFCKTRDDFYQAILLGMLAGFATLHLQGLLEWIFRQTQVFYLFVILSGLMVAIGNMQRPQLNAMRASVLNSILRGLWSLWDLRQPVRIYNDRPAFHSFPKKQ